MSFIDDLGILALPSRLERLSVMLKNDAISFYKEYYKRIKYKWYPILFVIYSKPKISILELSSELSYAHPSVIQIIKELEEAKLIISRIDKLDKRRRLVSLTAKGNDIVGKIIPYSKFFEKALTELTNGEMSLMKSLDEVEKKLKDVSFYNRVKNHLPE